MSSEKKSFFKSSIISTSNFFKGFFKGRSNRKELIRITFIVPILLLIGCIFTLYLSMKALPAGETIGSQFYLGTTLFIGFVTALFANFLLSIKTLGQRLQDLGHSSFWVIPILTLTPIFYFIVLTILYLVPSSGHNKYGPQLDKYNIKDKSLINYFYFKYFQMNPTHTNMSPDKCLAYNQEQAKFYRSLISDNSFELFELKFQNNGNISPNESFEQIMGMINGDEKLKNISKNISNSKIEDFDFSSLYSEIKDYSNRNSQNSVFHNKEING